MRAWIALSVLASAAASCSGSADAEPHAQAVPMAALRIRGVKAEHGSVEAGAALIGRLEPYERAALAVRLDGVLSEVRVDVGDRVEARQVLAVLSVAGLASQAEAASARSEAARRETELRDDAASRATSIADRNRAAIAEQEVIAAQNAHASADARATSAGAEAKRLRELIADTRLLAPFDGVVVARRRDRGASVSAGDVILEVVRVDMLRIRLEVPEAQAALVRVGAPVTAVLPTLSGRRIETTVSRFAPTLDPRTRMLPVEIDVPNPDGSLVGGARVQLTFSAAAHEGVLVPSEALLHEGSETVVYVATEAFAQRKAVRAGYDNGVRAHILEGVAAGEVVLVGGRGLLREGQPVEVAR